MIAAKNFLDFVMPLFLLRKFRVDQFKFLADEGSLERSAIEASRAANKQRTI